MWYNQNPVREILRRLEHEELVQSFPFKSTFVICLHIEDIKGILDLRIALESFAAKLSAQKIIEEKIKKIKDLER